MVFDSVKTTPKTGIPSIHSTPSPGRVKKRQQAEPPFLMFIPEMKDITTLTALRVTTVRDQDMPDSSVLNTFSETT
jgi:hypothetical protein